MKKFLLVFILLSYTIYLLPSQKVYKVIDSFREHSLCQSAIKYENRQLSEENRKYVYFTCRKNRTSGSFDLLLNSKENSQSLKNERQFSHQKGYTPSTTIVKNKQTKSASDVIFDINLNFEDFNNSRSKNTKVSSKEVDEVFSQLVSSLSYDLLNDSEEVSIFSFKLIDKHKESIGVTKKRKYLNQLKNYRKNLDKSLKMLESGESRKKSRIDSTLKKITKHIYSYGGEFLRKAELEEKKIIYDIYKEKKEKKYKESLIPFEIDSDVNGLEIYADKTRLGKTPFSIYLEPRKYSFVLQNKAFKIKKVINPKEKRFLFAKSSDSSWTGERIDDIKLLLDSNSLSRSSHQTSEKSFFSSLESIKTAKEFISSYNRTQQNNPELDKKVSELNLDSEIEFINLQENLNKSLLNTSSLSDLEKKIKLSKKLNKDLSKNGLEALNTIAEKPLVAYLDAQDPKFEIRNDRDFNLINESELKDLGKERFLIYSKVLSNDIDQKILSQKTDVEGSFHADTRQIYNPAYDKALQRRDKEWRDWQDAQIRWQKDQDTCARQSSSSRAFWCAVLLAPSRASYDTAQATLERTPRVINEKIYQSYYFMETKIQAVKSISYEIGIIDLKNRKIYRKEFTDESNKKFKVYSRMRPDERNANKFTGDSEMDIEKFLEKPYKIKLSDISKKIEDYKFTTRSANLNTSLNNFVASLKKESQNYVSSNKQNINQSEYLDADDRFYSVVKVLDKIQGGLGTGFYISKNEIITNAHVVGSAKIINLVNFKGEEFTGRVVKVGTEVDLALIKVNKRGTPVEFRDRTNKIKVGTEVEAIGHPKGYDYSINRGVVSSLREISLIDFGRKVKYIQSDVPINPGNSGGPLYIDDQVIGVNTWRDKRVTEGLNFAIYYSEVIDFVD